MDQILEGTPKAEIKLDGHRVTRSDVSPDWGSKLRWQVRRDGQEIATAPARMEMTFEHADTAPGMYEVVLQMFKYINYTKNAQGEYTESKFVDVSNVVNYTI